MLTKRLGIGVLASALKNGVISEEHMMPAIEEAAALNARGGGGRWPAVGVHACTDVSGFGLLGHLGEMLDASGAGATVRLADAPLHDGVLDLISAVGLRRRPAQQPRLPAAAPQRSAGEADVADDAAAARPVGEQEPRVLALFDPQTSGGLLMAVAPEKHAFLLEQLAETGVGAWTVGEVTVAGRRAPSCLEG